MTYDTRGCTILMVDDEEANLDLLEAFLLTEGYTSIARTTDPREAVALFAAHEPDLVLLDLHMPHTDGFEVLRQIRERTPDDDYLPVLVLTADITPDAKERALSGGARDFLLKPFDGTEVLLRVHNLLETRLMHARQREARERAEALAEENARLFAEAQWATRARDRMLGVVAHDLRNPLALVSMNAEMMLELLSPSDDAFQRETLAVIRQATERMQRLIEDLLDASQLEQGSFALRLSDQPIGTLAEEAEAMLRPVAEAHGIALTFHGARDLPLLRVDAARVLQVVSNLVGNAIKFTPAPGRVEVRWQAAGERIEIAVADSGPGIAPEQLPHLFVAFWQAASDDRRGVGLGLWIARSVVEAHGGRIWVDLPETGGSTFRFTLPFAPAPEAAAPVLPGAESGAASLAPAS